MPDIVIIPQFLEESLTSGAFRLTGTAIESGGDFVIGWATDVQYSATASEKNDAIRAAAVAGFADISIIVGSGDRKDIIGGAV